MSYTNIIVVFILLASMPAYAQQNVARNKPVIATSAGPGNPVDKVVDGVISRSSRWVALSNKAPHILEIDLLRYCTINEIRVHSGIPDSEKNADETTQAAGFWSLKNFKLQYWDDANWSDFPQSEVHENRLVTATFKYNPAINTFKIRLVCDDGEPVNIMEIEALGTEALNMPPPPAVASDIKVQPNSTGPQTATVTVDDKVIGKSLKYVGYNQGYYFPGTNVSGWLEYSNVNSLRVWAALNAFVPQSAVQVDKSITSVIEFDNRKEELRNSPENNRFVRWNELTPLYNKVDSSSTNAMVFDYALSELKRLGIDVILQIGSTDFNDTWENKWKQWQRYYALAYYSAKKGDVTMFAMQNEPNHRNSGPMKLDQWISGMQIVSDAIHCAVEDVNKKYGKDLTAKFVGPVTAGNNPEWWAAVAKNIRTDYHGKTLDKDLLEIFSTHSYNSPAVGYETRIENIRKIIVQNHPAKQPLPITYTEIGRWMNAYLIDKEETMDSPSLFAEWAGIYSNNMKNRGYGMWAFKFANTTSGPYPRGIKSGHHYTWHGRRIVEDAYKNLASGRPVKTSASKSPARFVTDGNKTDSSAWISDTTAGEKWIEINLGSAKALGFAVVYTGSASGVYTAPDRIKNFSLQYLSDNTWKNIAGTEVKDNKYAQVFFEFKEPVSASKVRFISTDKGNLKVREIKLFAKDNGHSGQPNYNVSGIQRTGEVVRLFAKGFKDERPLYDTRRSVDDNGFDACTSYDERSGNYYMWLVQRGLTDYNLDIDLSALDVMPGAPVTAETVSPCYYGELTGVTTLPISKKFKFRLTQQSVVLLTVPKASIHKTTILARADATVAGGKYATTNYGTQKQLLVRLDASQRENNKVAYIHFDLGKQPADMHHAVLTVNGRVDKGARPYRLHVYAIPSGNIDQSQVNWKNAPLLDQNEALIQGVGQKAFVAGEIAFTTTQQDHMLDVTDVIKRHAGKGIMFVFVRETRQLGDDEDKGRQVMIDALETANKPRLDFWFQK